MSVHPVDEIFGQVGPATKARMRRGGWKGSPNSLRNLRPMLHTVATCRICAAKGKWQPAVRGTDLCRWHGGLMVATVRGTRRKDTDTARVAHRQGIKQIKRETIPDELAQMAIWRDASRHRRSGLVLPRLLAAYREMVEHGRHEGWLAAVTDARRFLAPGGQDTGGHRSRSVD